MDFDGWKRRPDPVSLSALLESVEPRVERICRRILRDPHDAEEAKQEVLLEIASGLDAINDGAHFDRWVGRVAFRTALDRLRMRRRRVAREHAAAGRAPNGTARDDELHEAMSRLDDNDRDLIIERYFDRRTFREMGRRHGISAVAVRKRIAGAQNRLKRMLGCAIPGAFWKGAVTIGVAAMKSKAAAGLAVVIIPLLLLGGGVFVASARRGATQLKAHTSGLVSSESRPEEQTTAVGRAKPPKGSPPVTWAVSPINSIQGRFRMIAILDRLDWARGRAAECKRTARDQLTEEEGRRLQREAKDLEEEGPGLYRELKELASRDPATVVDILKNERGKQSRWNLASMIKSHLESEIASENSPSGPLLAGILSLETGDLYDKVHLLHLGASMERTNLEFGRVMLRLMNDSEGETANSAMHCVYMHARRGHLMEFLREHAARFREFVEAEGEGRYGHGRSASPIMAVAALDTPESDDFVLQRFESADTRRINPGLVESVLHVSPRLSESQEARLHATLHRTLHDQANFYTVYEVAVATLSKERCIEILRILAASPPSADAGAPERIGALIQMIEAGELESIRKKNREWRERAFSGKTSQAIAVPR
jgi:RNA polymerase sigma factor (sigma-70 family)